MTYIIAGKLKDSTFMMSDCIVTVSATKSRFACKTTKLNSASNTYYSMTGYQIIDSCVKTYDEWLFKQGRTSDFIHGNESISALQKIINKTDVAYKKLKMNGINRLFFLDETNVVYYDVTFNKKGLVDIKPDRRDLKEGTFIDSAVNTFDAPLPLLKGTLEDFCIFYLHRLSNKKLDFKGRFAYVELNVDSTKDIIKWPYQHYSDYIAEMAGTPYHEIDDAGFILHV